jgi:hypothetical protein
LQCSRAPGSGCGPAQRPAYLLLSYCLHICSSPHLLVSTSARLRICCVTAVPQLTTVQHDCCLAWLLSGMTAVPLAWRRTAMGSARCRMVIGFATYVQRGDASHRWGPCAATFALLRLGPSKGPRKGSGVAGCMLHAHCSTPTRGFQTRSAKSMLTASKGRR